MARRSRDESGFTLIELIIVCLIFPVVVGAIAVALISLISLQGGVSSRIADSADAQIVSSRLDQDVQSAVSLTTNTTAQCGSGSQLLGLGWSPNQQSGVFQSVVSYVEVPRGTTFSMRRQYCASGPSSVPTSISTVSYDIGSAQLAPTIAPAADIAPAAAGWISTQGVTGVSFSIIEPGSNYPYTLVALPASMSSPQSAVVPPTTSCGFATPGTGTYASTLCFVDFTSYVAAQALAPLCQKMSAAITNTPFTLTFCVSVSGGTVAAAAIPTYFAPPTSEAFLGNNGFYTGIPGLPALYQTTQGTTTTVTITGIQVLDSNGNAATGWEFVSGDAESTDANESISWTSNQNQFLLPNSTTSQVGNACATANFAVVDLTGVGTTSTLCKATVNSDKTGTVMLEALTPTNLTVQMVGAGLQAIFVGLLLP